MTRRYILEMATWSLILLPLSSMIPAFFYCSIRGDELPHTKEFLITRTQTVACGLYHGSINSASDMLPLSAIKDARLIMGSFQISDRQNLARIRVPAVLVVQSMSALTVSSRHKSGSSSWSTFLPVRSQQSDYIGLCEVGGSSWLQISMPDEASRSMRSSTHSVR